MPVAERTVAVNTWISESKLNSLSIQITRRENGAYVASCTQVPDLHTEGMTLSDVLHRLAEGYDALSDYYARSA